MSSEASEWAGERKNDRIVCASEASSEEQANEWQKYSTVPGARERASEASSTEQASEWANEQVADY